MIIAQEYSSFFGTSLMRKRCRQRSSPSDIILEKRGRGRFRNSCHLVFLKKEIYKKHNFILNLNFIEQEKIFVFIHAIASYIILHLIFKESRKKIKPRSARQGGATARKCYIKSATCSPHILNCISL